MASRQLRKLRKQQELLNNQEKASRDELSDDDAPIIVAKPRANPFSGFAALGGDGGDEDDDNTDPDEEAEQTKKPEPTPESEGQLDGASAPAKKSKKSKKKKKKGKQKAAEESTAPADDKNDDSLDEIDKVLAELNVQGKGNTAPETHAGSHEHPESQIAQLLSINFQHLKAMNEMRKMFGRTGHLPDENPPSQQPRTRAGGEERVSLETFLSAPPDPRHQGKTKGMFETVLRTNPFIEGKKHWPRDSAHGLKMERVAALDYGFAEFSFVQDKNYEQLEQSFFGLVNMYDPMQLVYFLQRYPYHVSTLIQVSKVAKQQDQNNALAADLIDRALFTLGRVSLSEFRKKLEEGKARISFYRPENRQLWLAGYFLIRHLILKGTVRTALEWTKLLLSLDPTDPYGLINWIHPLAIRAYEAQWFIDLRNKSKLLDNDYLDPGLYIKQTLVLAYLQLKETELARGALMLGLCQVPWLYCSLFSALGLDTPPSIWGIKPRSPEEELHTELYMHMTKDLWDTPSTINFLKSVASSTPRSQEYASLPPSPAIDLATARFIYLDNTPSLMSLVPSEMLHGSVPNYDYDPLPPPRAQNVFSSRVQEFPWTVAEEEERGGAGRARGGAARVIFNNPAMLRVVRRAAMDRLVSRARQGQPFEAELESLGEAIGADGEWMREFRDELARLVARDPPPPPAAAGAAWEQQQPARPARPFQPTVEDADDDGESESGDEEGAYDPRRPTGGPAFPEASEAGQDDSGGSNIGLLGMLLNAAGLGGFARGTATDGGEDGDRQGLPEPVYRALEDLELPNFPGAWVPEDEEEIFRGDYSALLGDLVDNDDDNDADEEEHVGH